MDIIKTRPRALALVLLSVITSFYPVSADEYVRYPPRSIIQTPHKKPPSHAQQVHISVVGKDQMRISWITEDKKASSLVEYGKQPGNYSASATGEHSKYEYFLYTSGTIHHTKIGPLEPDTTYYYRLGGIADEFSFKTPPNTLPINFAIIGDLGQTEWTASTLSHIGKTNYDMLLLPGDLSYADSQQPLWDSFGRLVEPYASKRPWMVTEGNHDVEPFLFNLVPTFAAYNVRWRMPYEESGSISNLYYSFGVAGGAVHVIMLGSYADFDVDSEQYRWLVGDLVKVDRRVSPWVIVLMHTPWYNTNTAHQGEGEKMRKAMERLLYDYRVDIVFSGHVHAYQRFTRIYNNEANACGPVYITIGDGGNREGLALIFNDNMRTSGLSVFREASFGHGRLGVVNGTHARWAWHRNDDKDSTVRDEVWLESLSSVKACDARIVDDEL